MSYRNLSFWLLAIFHNWQFTNGPWGMYLQFSLSALSFFLKEQTKSEELVIVMFMGIEFFQNIWRCNMNN